MRDCGRDYICVIGSLNYDIIMKQKRMPLLGETYTADSITYSLSLIHISEPTRP